LVVGLTALLVFRRQRWPLAWVLWLCHLVLLVPVLGLTEHPHYPSDRYSFIVGIPWSVLIVAGLFKLGESPYLRQGALIAAAATLAGLGALSYRQAAIWRNSIALHEYMILKLGEDPHRVWLYLRLGKVYLDEGNGDKAANFFRQALQINPASPEAHWYLATVLQGQGRLDEAIREYQEVFRINPDDFSAHHNLGVALVAQGKLEEAITHLSEAVRLGPNNPNAHRNLARALAKLGRLGEAQVHEAEAQRLEMQPQRDGR
jgi:tetratricopeptide (TPR) repeat protein